MFGLVLAQAAIGSFVMLGVLTGGKKVISEFR